MEFCLNLRADNTPTMNFNNAATKQMTDGFVAAGLWTQGQVDGLLDTLARRKRSRALELWGQGVALMHVARAMWPGKFAVADAAFTGAMNRVNELSEGIDDEI